MKALFVFSHLGFLRNFEQTIHCLLKADVEVEVFLCKEHDTIRQEQFELVQSAPANFQILDGHLTLVTSETFERKVRFWRDVLHYLQPGFRSNKLYWERLQFSSKRLLKPSTLQGLRRRRLLQLALVRRVMDAMLSAAERFIPIDPQIEACFDRSRPDVVVVSPLVAFHSLETDFVKAARRRRIPSLLAVASWDNLVNKGIVKVQPDAVSVWNRAMANEAVRYHRIPRRRIFLTGSPIFDVWFGRKPREDRATFLGKLGLDPERPTVLYLCSSGSIVGKHEHILIATWLARVRTDPTHPARKANILIRPHPMNLAGWEKAELKDSAAVVWPRMPAHPTDEETRSGFFDSIYHSTCVVGVNTSGMIEAAIVGRPVLCFSLGEKYQDKRFDERWQFKHQQENLHFQHLLDSGFVKYAFSLDGHLDQLRAALMPEAAAEAAAAAQRFVGEFVRPLGPEVNASRHLADRIRDLAANGR